MVDEMSITTAIQHEVATYNIELLFFEGAVLMSIFMSTIIPSSDQRRGGGSGGVNAGGSD